MNLEQRLEAVEKVAHEPQDIAPRVIEELERAVVLLNLFVAVPTEHLEKIARVGLEMRQYYQDERQPEGDSR